MNDYSLIWMQFSPLSYERMFEIRVILLLKSLMNGDIYI